MAVKKKRRKESIRLKKMILLISLVISTLQPSVWIHQEVGAVAKGDVAFFVVVDAGHTKANLETVKMCRVIVEAAEVDTVAQEVVVVVEVILTNPMPRRLSSKITEAL